MMGDKNYSDGKVNVIHHCCDCMYCDYTDICRHYCRWLERFVGKYGIPGDCPLHDYETVFKQEQMVSDIDKLQAKNARLEKLNLEMVEVIEDVRRWYVNGSRSGKTLNDMLTLLFELADKAEGREE